MSEPAIPAVAGGVGLAFGLTGTFLGISYGVLLGGFLAGIIVVMLVDGITAKQAAAKLMIALATAAGLGDITSLYTAKKLGIEPALCHIPVGLLIGFTAQTVLLPWITSTFSYAGGLIKKLIGRWLGEVSK